MGSIDLTLNWAGMTALGVFILAYVLGEIAEISLFQTLLISDTGLWIFVTRPISLVLTLLIGVTLSLPFAAPLKRRWRNWSR